MSSSKNYSGIERETPYPCPLSGREGVCFISRGANAPLGLPPARDNVDTSFRWYGGKRNCHCEECERRGNLVPGGTPHPRSFAALQDDTRGTGYQLSLVWKNNCPSWKPQRLAEASGMGISKISRINGIHFICYNLVNADRGDAYFHPGV